MKQSVGIPGRLASAQSVRSPLRRNLSGIAEKIFVSIRRGGVSRYMMVGVIVGGGGAGRGQQRGQRRGRRLQRRSWQQWDGAAGRVTTLRRHSPRKWAIQ